MSFFEARHYHMQVSQDEGRNEINVTVYPQPDFHYTRKNSQAATNLKLLTNCVRTACFKLLEQVVQLGEYQSCYKIVSTRLEQSYNNIVTALCCKLCGNHVTTGLHRSC